MAKIFIFLFFTLIIVFAGKTQEKRIALVIGNSDYIHASSLKNPVNDAELMRFTLASLGFEVMMANNLKTQRQFLDTIRSFQRKSASYNVRFVYYAGHAVQIGEENYLLPTEERYQNATDFKDYALPLGLITKEFTAEEKVVNVINVVILDACRDNPNKNVESRGVVIESLYKERSSNEVLIAYATTSGAIAADGLKDGKNSVFCSSLAKHMMLPDVPFEEVLKRVRIDVKTSLNQKPEYLNSLDQTLYLKKSSYTDQIIKIDSLIEVGDFKQAETKLEVLLAKAPDYKLALLRRGRVGYNTINKKYDGSHLFKADSLYPNDPEVHEYLGRYYSTIGEDEKAIKYINRAIEIDYNEPQLFYWRARFFEEFKETKKAEADYTQSIVLDSTVARFLNRAAFYERINNYEQALADYTKAISMEKENPELYDQRADCYIAKEDLTAALKDLDKAIDLAPNDPYYYNNRADFYKDYKTEYELALKDYASAWKFSNDSDESSRTLNNRALIYEKQEKLDVAAEEFTKAIEIYPNDPLFYSNRARIYQKQLNYEQALADYKQAITIDKENPRWYDERANCYIAKEDLTAALKDLDKAIELAPNDPYYYNNRADFYKDYKTEYELALKDYATALKLSNDPYESYRTLNNRATIYENQEKLDLAAEEYTKAIEIYLNDPIPFSNRARIYQKQEKYELALADYTQAISLEKENPELYDQRANCYIAKEDLTAALKDLDKTIDLAPNDPYYYNNRADFYKDYKMEYELALGDFAIAWKLSNDPYESYRTLNNRATIYEDQEKLDLAAEEYTKAIEIYPNDPIPFSNRARIYQKQEKYELALADYTQAISLEKENPELYDQRANCYIANEDLTAALKDLDKAIELAPNDPYYYNNRADFYNNYKTEYELAFKDYASAWKFSNDSDESSRTLNNRALIYEKQEKLDLAAEEYTKAIEIYPNDPIPFSNRARIYQKQEKYELALADYTQAISLEKENPELYDQRANCYIANEDLTAALKDLDKAIDLAPNDPYYYNNRADFYVDYKNEANLALKDYASAWKFSNDSDESSRTLNNRALIYENQEKLDLALEEYTKAIEISPKEPVYYSNRARIYQKQLNYELALADYTQAIQIDSKNGFWYYSRGEFLENVMNKPFDALVNYSLAISLDSMEMSYWWQRGQLFSEKLSNQVMAIQDYDQILKIQPNDINSLNWRTIFYHRNNEISKAIEGYKKIINLGDSIKKLENKESDYGWANINLAEIYQSENKTKEALMLYNEALEYNSDDVEYYYWRAWFLTMYMSRYDEAISDFSSAIKLEPKNPNWLLNRSKIYQLKGDLKSAANDINEAIKISKESSSYLAERGNFYSLIGEYDKATKDFKESLKLDSNNRRLYHYVTEDLIRKGKLNDAIDNAMRSVRIFKQDTVSYEQLGRIYYTKNDLQKSLSLCIQAASIMEFNEEYRTIYPHDIQIFLSDVYLKIAEIYKKLNQSDLECEALQKAESIVIFETRRDRQKMIIEIQERLKTCQN